jgi:hypothetical protein
VWNPRREEKAMNPIHVPPEEIAAWIGIDWADQEYVVSLSFTGSAQVETSRLKQHPEALQTWVRQLYGRDFLRSSQCQRAGIIR